MTLSIYAKAGTLSWVKLLAITTSEWANFNVSTGALGFKSAGATSRIEALGSGWYRCSYTYTYASGSTTIEVRLMNSDINDIDPVYAGTGSTMHVWGAQVEAGDYPTSYIPTTTAAVTRAPDVVTLIGESLTVITGAANSGVMSMDMIPRASGVTGLIYFDTGNASLYKDAPENVNCNLGAAFAAKGGLTSAVTVAAKYGYVVNASGCSVTGQGLTPATGAGTPAFGAICYLGARGFGPTAIDRAINTYVRSLKLWNTRLSDANLALETDGGSAVPPTIDIDLTVPSAVATDPHWASVNLLLDYDAPHGTLTFVDQKSSVAMGVSGSPNHDTGVTPLYGTSSFQLDTGETVTFADSPLWTLGTSNFTIDFTARPTNITGTRFWIGHWMSSPNLEWVLYQLDDKVAFNISTNGTASTIVLQSTAGTLVINTWARWRLDFDGIKYRLYKGGVMVASSTTLYSTYTGSTDSLQIGSTAFPFIGNCRGIRLTVGVVRTASDSGYAPINEAFPAS